MMEVLIIVILLGLIPAAIAQRKGESFVVWWIYGSLLFIVALSVNLGMWVERFVIVITSLHRDFVPSSWGMYFPTIWDWAALIGSVGLFLTLLFLFIRFLPMISISESRELLAEREKARTA